jgi:hypothetical protein
MDYMRKFEPEEWTLVGVEREIIPENAEDFLISDPKPALDSLSGLDDWRLVFAPTPWIERKLGLYMLSCDENDEFYYKPFETEEAALDYILKMMKEGGNGQWWGGIDLDEWFYSNKGSIDEDY